MIPLPDVTCSACAATVPYKDARDFLGKLPDPGWRKVCTNCWLTEQRAAAAASLPRTLTAVGVPKRLHSARAFDIHPDVWGVVDGWRAGAEALYIFGPTGSGKSYLAAAVVADLIVREALSEEQLHWFAVVALVDELAALGSGPRALAELVRLPLLVIDDLGTERRSDFVQERLDALISGRHDAGLRTVVTSNVVPSALGERSTRMASRLLSGVVVRLSGSDRRLSARHRGGS